MKELNELVGLAAAYESAETRKEAFEVVERFDQSCGFKAILEIDVSYRALEQKMEKEIENHLKMTFSEAKWRQRAEAAEAKLAELEKQEPFQIDNLEHFISFWRKFSEGEVKPGKNEVNHTLWLLESLGKTELFTRPAPAVRLADLVPEKWTLKEALKFVEGYTPPSEEEAVLFAVNSFRAAILRNIEESK